MLVRTCSGLAVGGCPPPVTLRRNTIGTTALAAFKRKADSVGFYALPAEVMGASFCRGFRSDAVIARLSIYHTDGSWSVRGYKHCPASPQKLGLLAMESMVDSLAALPRRRRF